ncbi:MAG: hypothetical protein ABIN95_11045 [Mucilaginibacter sp.]
MTKFTLFKRLVLHLTLVTLLAIATSCSLKLSEKYLSVNKKIYKQQWGVYCPKGFQSMMLSPGCQGVLALGDNEFIFDVKSVAVSLPMIFVEPFTIKKADIDSVRLSEPKKFKKKVLFVKATDGTKYEFVLSNADSFYAEMKTWLANSQL